MALVTSAVKLAMANVYGTDCQLLDWTTKDFTQMGDNYTTVVTSIEVDVSCATGLTVEMSNKEFNENCRYTNNNDNIRINEARGQPETGYPSKIHPETGYPSKMQPKFKEPPTCKNCASTEENNNLDTIKKETFVAKFLPDRDNDQFRTILENLHEREGKFFEIISKRVNSVLYFLKMNPLSIPKCYYASYCNGSELLITEDMRKYGYVMTDPKMGINFDQAKLIMQELAKLHAASYVLSKQNNNENFNQTYSFIQDLFIDPHHHTLPFFEKFFGGILEGSATLLRSIKGYTKASEKLLEFKNNIMVRLAEQINLADDKFRVICHGDTWCNNFLFK